MTRIMQAVIILCLIAMVSWLVFSGFQNASEASTRDRQNTALIDQNRGLIAEIQTDSADAAAERARAATNQYLLLEYTKQLAARQDSLLSYLRAHGIKLPTRYVTVIPAPILRTVIVAPKAPAAHGKHKGKK